MTIRTDISPELWETVQKNYDSENYTGAILDAVFKLTDVIRNKTGLEGDGANLVGQAFGGDNPRIKLNNLQTDSERDVQRGMQELLKGIYTAIRNPRSHDSMSDSRDSADAIIIFINHLLKLIDQSKLNFSEDKFLERVFDPCYVQTTAYSQLLIKEIPKRQRANIAIKTILQREQGDIYALGAFLHTLFDQLDPADLSRVFKVISEELKITTSEESIRYLVHICPGKYWKQLDPAVRIRTESILFKDFSEGTYSPDADSCGPSGALATWITGEHLQNFEDVDVWTRHAIDKLQEGDDSAAYIQKYFWHKICFANYENITWPLIYYFSCGLENNDSAIITKLTAEIQYKENHPWWNIFSEGLKMHPEIICVPKELPF